MLAPALAPAKVPAMQPVGAAAVPLHATTMTPPTVCAATPAPGVIALPMPSTGGTWHTVVEIDEEEKGEARDSNAPEEEAPADNEEKRVDLDGSTIRVIKDLYHE